MELQEEKIALPFCEVTAITGHCEPAHSHRFHSRKRLQLPFIARYWWHQANTISGHSQSATCHVACCLLRVSCCVVFRATCLADIVNNASGCRLGGVFHFSFPHKSNIGQRNQDPHNHYKALCVLEVALKYKEKLPARKLLSFSTTYTVIKT